MLKSGLYEQVINNLIAKELEQTDWIKKIEPIDPQEASRILSKYLSDIIETGLEYTKSKAGDINGQISLVNKLIRLIKAEIQEDFFEELIINKNAKQLLALLEKTNSIYSVNDKAEVIRPETSIAVSSLFTGAIHEPSMFSELKKEILSCDRIDMLVSFIKWSGLRLIIEELRDFISRGGILRIITTSYMGATDIKAVEELSLLPNTEINISYDTKRTRLHAKAYIFYRDTGFTTAYVGSSNLSNAAMSSGLEWNVKITAKDLPDTLNKIQATFDSYWISNDFEIYDIKHRSRLQAALRAEKATGLSTDHQFLFDITPYPYQQEILDRLSAERKIRGMYRNLIVAATGTGKTVISAFDYKRFCKENKTGQNRLLFVAHREEILRQSIDCFRAVLKDPDFGDLFVGSYHPESIENLFISIQTFNSQDFHEKTTPNFYDYIVIDEFHHAAAITYQKLLNYYKPLILLGLTATPERMDGKNILEYFDDRIAAQIRLPEAIERKLLAPFQYFGVSDTVDLNDLKWVRGGYEKSELANLYSINLASANRRADNIIDSLHKYVTDIEDVKGLGFCVSREHAKFMSDTFNSRHIPSICLTSYSDDEERNTAKKRLVDGNIRFIFVVDIYNEGVDIPEINTVLFLRPTESLTVFLQQLGRGLRLAENKECLTVLDFIGQANKKYNFEDKFAALLSNTNHSLSHEIKAGFKSVPKGCYIQLEKKAKESILENIRSSFNTKAGIIARIATFKEDSGLELELENFIRYYHMDIRSLYRHGSFSRLCSTAGIKSGFSEELEVIMSKAFLKICAIDSRRWIDFLVKALPDIEHIPLNPEQIKMLNMLQFTIWQKSYKDCGFNDIRDGFIILRDSPVIFAELLDLLKYNYEHIDFIDERIDFGFECPLDLYCAYTRDQILVALDYDNPSIVREGVKYLPDKKTDVFFITLNKSDKDYSPTTMYNDYSMNEWLFHWQSQSTTSVESPTGQRYINQRKTGSRIMLFVREFKTDISGTSPYTFLGLADIVKYEGSRPINIVWKLRAPIPAKYLKKTNKLVVG